MYKRQYTLSQACATSPYGAAMRTRRSRAHRLTAEATANHAPKWPKALHEYRSGGSVTWHGFGVVSAKRSVAASSLHATGGHADSSREECEVVFKIYSKGAARDVSAFSGAPWEAEGAQDVKPHRGEFWIGLP